MSMLGDPDYEEQESESRLFQDVASLIGDPDYLKFKYINDFNKDSFDYQKGYSALRVKFNFPDNVKFPPLPVNLDENITIYPLSGETTVTGLEYFSAKNILNEALIKTGKTGNIPFKIKILNGVYIPFKTGNKPLCPVINKPFFPVINELQANRRKYAEIFGKKSAMERIYKDLGNMLYGKVVCGISNKRSYDARSNSIKPLKGFVRALIAELLHIIHNLGGKVVSCTTDGFVCDIENLEQKIINSNFTHPLLNSYREIRNELSGCQDALEIKTSVRGIIQWTTRGQLSLDSTETGIPIAAMTGFQKYHFEHDEITSMVKKVIGRGNSLPFYQKSLTGAKQLYQDFKQVSMIPSLRNFKTIFDSKRSIIFENGIQFLDTKPFENVNQALLHRTLLNHFRNSIYSKKLSYAKARHSSSNHHFIIERFL
ncbi:hypothetical protein HOY82DRAFT_544413 [Tuber indicum]|nr:hypothetical protein HOY82DRAFT_544413 [Tuber indicum]